MSASPVPGTRWLLWLARPLVPRSLRRDWSAEWQAELWHVSQTCNQREVTAFCLGAFHDALWLRRNTTRCSGPGFAPGSSVRCGLFLTLWAAAGLLVCFYLPGARKVLPLSLSSASDALVMLSSDGYTGAQAPAIRLADYRSWKISTRHLFRDLAFYQPTFKRVRIAPHQSAQLAIIRASSNLFPMLKISSGDVEGNPALMLSDSSWRKDFQGDPQIVGRTVEIGARQVRIVGVLPLSAWRLPGQADAWLLEGDREWNLAPPGSRGFVLAQLKTTGFPAVGGDWHFILVPRPGGGIDRFDCVPIEEQTRLPLALFLFSLFVACLALPATTPLPLGEYPSAGEHLPWKIRARRWLFLTAKLLLIVPGVYFASIALAYGIPFAGPATPQYLQLGSSFAGLLFAFRWALQDQRKRCPVCLRRLTNPAHVGEASRNFLAWNGLELICTGGHGLLHIPEIPTSWFSTQRWLYLDPSWKALFSDAKLAPSPLI